MDFNQIVSNWLDKASCGNPNNIEVIFSRYFNDMIRLARSKMHGLNFSAKPNEDVALSAIRSFYNRPQDSHFDFENVNELWGSLFRIAARKTCAERHRQMTQNWSCIHSIITSDSITDTDNEFTIFENFAGSVPSPELTQQVAQCGDELLNLVKPFPTHYKIVAMKLEGYTTKEIARELGLPVQAVYTNLRYVRKKWLFTKALEYLIENTLCFDGISIVQVAETLDKPVELIEKSLRLMLNLWIRNAKNEAENRIEQESITTNTVDPKQEDTGLSGKDPQQLAELLEQLLFDPQTFKKTITSSSPEKDILHASSLETISQYWLRHIKLDWSNTLWTLWKKYE